MRPITRHRASLILAAAILAAPAAARADFTPPNLALDGYPWQSSTVNDPFIAIDGVDGGYPDGYTATMTGTDFHSWWQVDLGDEYHLGTIEVVNRADCCFDAIVPFAVIVADFPLIDTDITDADGFTYPGVTRVVVGDAVRSRYVVPIHRKGRYVMIGLLREYTPLALGEVQVFEEPNAASDRLATQSATLGNAIAGRAVDNNLDGYYPDNSVSVAPGTTATPRPFWDLTLDNSFPIESIDVYTTNTSCCSGVVPRPTFTVYTGLDTAFNSFGATTMKTIPAGVSVQSGNAQGAPATVSINRTVESFRVQLDAADSLSIAEVKVWPVARGAEGAYASISSKATSTVNPFSGIDFNVGPAGNDITPLDVKTQAQTDPYYDIDLGADRFIETVKVWGQTDTSSSNLFSVWTSEFSKFPTTSPDYTENAMRGKQLQTGAIEWKTVGVAPVTTVPIGQRARFIRVQMEGANQVLGLREVEVVTTEGYIDTPVNATVQTATTALGKVSGFHTRPNEPVDVYAFSPNFTTGSGYIDNWTYLGTAVSGSGAVHTPFAAAPLYLWSTPIPLTLPAGAWAPGGVLGLYAQAYVDYATGASIPTPLRGINQTQRPNDEFSVPSIDDIFWPHVRLVGNDKSPDTNATPPAYLTKPMGTTVAGTYYNLNSVGTAYKEIPDTLAQFNSRYLASRAVSATYYNVGDLGIGRKMTCAQPSWNVAATVIYGTACAVSNYAPAAPAGSKAPITFGNAAGTVALLEKNAPPFATVVMIKRTGSAGSMFGVYVPSTTPATTDPSKTKLVQTQVFLDSTGSNTAAPNNCMACHGGSAGGNPLDLTKPSMFLPFDPQSIGTGSDETDLFNKGWDWSHQEEAFRKLNAMVLAAGASDGIKDFINGSYGGKVGTSGTKINPSYIPQGWQNSAAQKKVYTEVIKPYCRGCHLAQSGALAFVNASDIEGLRANVLSDFCKTHTMPHSQVTTKKAWSTSARATLLAYFGREDLDQTTLSLEACKP